MFKLKTKTIMAKEPRTQISGKEARYILKKNNVNLSWLAEQLGITPQSVQSRLNATTFSVAYQLEINNIYGKRIFDVDMAPTITETKGRIPVIDMRVSAGFGVSLLDGNEQRINEYVTMDGLNRPIFNYVKIMRQHADAAIRKILDNLKAAESDASDLPLNKK